ncbi:MAG TPA: type II toxin-antitoxin system RelE/ParE family toxin [Methylomirabilota bacterium]|jgi:proteic killer suppression protein|nr:type II toxin-antitoxin system RelE/ParE family toxin [Methylomirabilota bacterium]
MHEQHGPVAIVTPYVGEQVNALEALEAHRSRIHDRDDTVRRGARASDARAPARFEALSGDRKGQYSIRINDRWRICFEWPEGSPGPVNVEIVDYHAEQFTLANS